MNRLPQKSFIKISEALNHKNEVVLENYDKVPIFIAAALFELLLPKFVFYLREFAESLTYKAFQNFRETLISSG